MRYRRLSRHRGVLRPYAANWTHVTESETLVPAAYGSIAAWVQRVGSVWTPPMTASQCT